MWRLAALAASLAAGCALLQVAAHDRASVLVPAAVQASGYAVSDDGAVTYRQGGLEVIVEPMSDAALNRLFPHESSLGEYSINPYTFGNYVDPEVGYVRNRFTVFRVTVRNDEYAKVELDPLRAVLTTDRRGELLTAYGILAGAAPRTFEGYYRARRGPSGNEYYRFNMRMGIVRSNNYGVGKKVFKGERYGGFVVFDPLDEAVRRVRLTLRDFVVKFSAFDVPLETVDLVFGFERRLVDGVQALASAAPPPARTLARLRAPSVVTGNATGDLSRDQGTLDERIGTHLAALNECFAAEYLAGRAAEGAVDVRFAIDAEGAVSGAELLRSQVVSEAVGRCLLDQVRQWTFGATDIPVALLVDDPQADADAYTVSVTVHLEFVDMQAP